MTRYKCTLKPGVSIERGVGAGPFTGVVYLYGDGPWGTLTLDDIETRIPCPAESETVSMQDGRDAPGVMLK
jgi:hypothetical protein